MQPRTYTATDRAPAHAAMRHSRPASARFRENWRGDPIQLLRKKQYSEARFCLAVSGISGAASIQLAGLESVYPPGA